MIDMEKRAKEMFDELRKHIGETVTVSYWLYGSMYSDTSTLRVVDDFGVIALDSIMTPFVGYGSAIVSIKDKDGNLLYYQPLYTPYDVRDTLGIIEMLRKLFGDRIANEAMKNHLESEKARIESQKREQIKIEEFNTTEAQELIDRTLPYVVEDQQEKFKAMVKNNSDSMYGICYVKMTSELLIAIGQGMDFAEAIRTIADDKYGTTGYVMGCAANAISHCSPRGEEFRKYWNGLHGVPEGEKGVVNPAILTIKKKN